MRGSMNLLLTGILMTTMLVGCSSQSDVSGGNSSRNAMEKQAISIYEDVNGVGSAQRDGFTDSVKNLSDAELRMILEN